MRMAIWALVLATGCAGPRYLSMAIERGMHVETKQWGEHGSGPFEGKGDVRLFQQFWRPNEVRASLVVMHGLKDHSGRYAPLAERLVQKGYAVYAFDLRGHGRSEGERVWVDSFDDYVDDLEAFVRAVKHREGGKPIFVMGHSMGGAIAALLALERKPELCGVILSAPAIRVDVPGVLVGITKATAALFPRAPLLSLDLDKFSRDPNAVQSLKTDRFIHQPAGPARTAAELFRAMERIRARQAELEVAVLALHGTADVVTDPEGTKALVADARSREKTLKLYEGYYHALLEEPGKEQVATDLIQWMDGKCLSTSARNFP